MIYHHFFSIIISCWKPTWFLQENVGVFFSKENKAIKLVVILFFAPRIYSHAWYAPRHFLCICHFGLVVENQQFLYHAMKTSLILRSSPSNFLFLSNLYFKPKSFTNTLLDPINKDALLYLRWILYVYQVAQARPHRRDQIFL